jgi:AcrR family transcriptional regulator
VAGALSGVSLDSTVERLATGLEAFFAFVEERRDAWRILFRDVADPETSAALDRIVEQVTVVVAALIAQDPGARSQGRDESELAIRVLAQMLVGAVQSVANWWAEHPEVAREQAVELVMDFAWVGLERLSAGERWTRES